MPGIVETNKPHFIGWAREARWLLIKTFGLEEGDWQEWITPSGKLVIVEYRGERIKEIRDIQRVDLEHP